MTFNFDINFSAFFLSGLLAFLLGLFWYNPKLLGSRWKELHATAKSPSTLTHVASFFLWTLSACFYAFLASFLGINTAAGFFCLSCLLWVAFAMPPTVMSTMNTGYPFEAMAIDAAYQLGGYYIFAAVHIAFLSAGILFTH